MSDWNAPIAVMVLIVAFAATGSSGCADDQTQRWELVHDRVIAVRATPPRLLAGEAAIIDLLITSQTAGPDEVAPAMLTVAPDTIAALAGVVHGDQVIAPDDETLDQARVALG